MSEISSTEVKEVSQGHWNNYGSNNYRNKKSCGKQDSYKGKKDLDRKPWHNKDQKQWNKAHKPQNNKESKPKDACIMITKDVKYFCSIGYDEGEMIRQLYLLYLCIYSSHIITPLISSSLYSSVLHRQVKGMVTLNLFIEHHYKYIVSIIRVKHILTHHLSTANCTTLTTTGCCCNNVAHIM